jgi:hypothetical protein
MEQSDLDKVENLTMDTRAEWLGNDRWTFFALELRFWREARRIIWYRDMLPQYTELKIILHGSSEQKQSYLSTVLEDLQYHLKDERDDCIQKGKDWKQLLVTLRECEQNLRCKECGHGGSGPDEGLMNGSEQRVKIKEEFRI